MSGTRTLASFSKFALVSALLAGCAGNPTQHLVTGEPVLYGVERRTGEIIDRDQWPSGDPTSPTIVPAVGDVVTISLNTLFLKRVKEFASPHVLVYAEVFDDGSDDPESAYTKILFEQKDQPSGALLGLADRVLYGPAVYQGYPLRVRIYVVELDKENKQQASQALNRIGSLTSYAPVQAQLPISLALDVAQAINALNEDDYELRFDLTLHPNGPVGTLDIGDPETFTPGPFARAQAAQHIEELAGDRLAALARTNRPPSGARYVLNGALRTGSYLIIKRELEGRGGPQAEYFRPDWAQRLHYQPVQGIDGSEYLAEFLLRLQGFRLYKVYRNVLPVEYSNTVKGRKRSVITQGSSAPGATSYQKLGPAQNPIEKMPLTVQTTNGPNAGLPFDIEPGIREDFDLQTYAVLTVSVGASKHVSQATLKGASDRDRRRLGELLDTSDDATQDMNQRLDAIASTAAAMLAQRQLAVLIGQKVDAQPGLRATPDYVLLWSGQLHQMTTDQPAEDSVERRNNLARNAGILEVLQSLIVNLPLVTPERTASVNAIRQITVDELEAIPESPGRFRLTDIAYNRIAQAQ
ncbi:MAG: hypothetical protein H6815_00080 [Phycisphaeraceae bacterium]|nr:hypothetical protein [Phycisphaerales bacterium]MCB9858825.1 hypothetical protein [Phycisphaeraceae bacterium]